MSEEPGGALASSVPPSPCAFWISFQSFELPHRPSNQMLVDAQCDGIQLGAIEEGGGEELPLPAPVKPDVSLSTHPAYYLVFSTKGSSLLPDWPSGPTRSGAFAPGPLQPLHHYYPPVRPSASHPVLSPSAFGLGVLPFPPISGEATTRLVPEFRTRARTTFLPPLRRTPPGQERDTSPGLSQGRASALVLMSSFYLSTRHRKVRFRSTPWCLPDRGSPAVSCNAQDPRS